MCSCYYPRMLCHVFWSQVKYKIVCFIYIFFTESGSYVGFPLQQVNSKNHEESDLQWKSPHFGNHTRNFYHNIFFIILTLRALDIFCFRYGMLLLLLYFKGIFLKSH